MIGARAAAIDKAEDRELFRKAMEKIGLETPRSRLADAASLKRADREKYKSGVARIESEFADPEARASARAAFDADWARHESERRRRYVEKGLIEALEAVQDIGLPAIIRPSFTLGGTGGGIAYNREEFLEIVERRLDASPTCEVLIEESCSAGKNTRWRSCAIATTIASSSARSRTSIRWGSYRRLDHRRAGADTDRQGISDHAQRLDRGAARDRRRDRRL